MSDATGADELVVAARYVTEDEARRAVETLLLRGFGATSEHRPGPGPSHVVLVVPGLAAKAGEILGTGEPEADVEPASRRGQVLWILAVFGVALIVLPLLAFLLSYKLSGG